MVKTESKVFARKYRPTNFLEILGQDFLVKTLSNSIIKNKLAQGYILTGTRGIGKTTTARVIAKTINCFNFLIENETPIPCNNCDNCNSFNDSSHLDIIEIDAASRTGVDDVRIIIDNAEYKPLLGKYKIFIIDEVHMLSKSAFNALLKLLEEPPLHVIFIFATTEIHKIPLTVISRCQRFDLHRFTKNDLFNLFKKICIEENIGFEDEALMIIASKSDGSARDGISILNQISLSHYVNDNIITAKTVNEILGLNNKFLCAELLLSISENNTEKSIDLIKKFYDKSSNFNVLLDQLLEIISYIAKKIAIKKYLLPEYSDIEDYVVKIMNNTDMTYIQISWQILFSASSSIKNSHNQLQFFEMLILKLIYAQKFSEFSVKILEEKNPNLDLDQKKNFKIAETKNDTYSNHNISKNYYDLKNSKPQNSSAQYSKNYIALDNQNNKNSFNSTSSFLSLKNHDETSKNLKLNLTDHEISLFIEFLEYLKKLNEMEIYYFLFNDSEIFKFSESIIIIHSNSINNDVKLEIKNLLEKFLNKNIDLEFKINDKILPLKIFLKNKFQNTKIWEKISNNFINSEISDIIMK